MKWMIGSRTIYLKEEEKKQKQACVCICGNGLSFPSNDWTQKKNLKTVVL